MAAKSAALFIAAAAGWLLLCGRAAGVVSVPWPLLATPLSFLLVLVLPGALLYRVLALPERGVLQVVPVAFLLGIGLWSVPAVVLTAFLHSNLKVMTWLTVGATGMLLAGAWMLERRRRDDPGAMIPIFRPAAAAALPGWVLNTYRLVALTSALFVAALFERYGYLEADQMTYLAFLRHFSDAEAIFTRGFVVEPAVFLGARHLFQPWLVIQALLTKIAGLDLIEAYNIYTPTVLILLSYAGLYLFSRELFEDERAALLACATQSLYFLSHYSLGSGMGAVMRLNEDKFFVLHVLLFTALWLALRYLKTGRKRYLAGLATGVAGVVLVHPMGIVFFGISLGGILFGVLLHRSRENLRRGLVLLLVTGCVAVVPLWERGKLREMDTAQKHTFDLAEGFSAYNGKARQKKLLVFSVNNESYIVNPKFLTHPLQVLPLLLTPLLVRRLRRERSAQFLLFGSASVLLICYTPGITPLFGKIITPWMLWRVTWLLPSVLAVVYFCMAASGATGRHGAGPPPWRLLMPLALVLGGGIVLAGDIGRTVSRTLDSRRVMVDAELRAAFGYLREHGTPGGYILTPGLYHDNQIPSLVGHSFGIAFRDRKVSEGVLEERRAFYQSDLIDTTGTAFLHAYRVDYLVVFNGSRLASMCRALPELFTDRFANSTYAIYQFRRERSTQPQRAPLRGYDLLGAGDLAGARAVFSARLATDPRDSLALLGACETARAAAAVAEAQACFTRLAERFPDDPLVLIKAGDLSRAAESAQPGVPGSAWVDYYLRALHAAPESGYVQFLVLQALARGPGMSADDPRAVRLREEALPIFQNTVDNSFTKNAFKAELISVYRVLGLQEQAARREAAQKRGAGGPAGAGAWLNARIDGLFDRLRTTTAAQLKDDDDP